MFVEERRAFILDALNLKGRCRVADLARELDVSEVTIRQDLVILEKQHLLNRTHGGAILNLKTGYERPFQTQETTCRNEKERIGKAAAELVSDGETIILDVGTTVTELARNLQNKKNLTVVTNALNIATVLEAYDNITVIVTGGTLRAKQHSLVNPYAQFILDKINVDIAFIGANGIDSDHGITNVNIAEAEIKSLFIKAARRKIVLADSSKLGNVALANIARLSEIDLLITDTHADRDEISRLQEMNLSIRQV